MQNKNIAQSLIQWTRYTVNFWIGCTRISLGCRFCYMFRLLTRYKKDPTKVHRTTDGIFYKALKLEGRQLIFTCSLSDFFHEAADNWREDAWDVIRATPQHYWQILTKRLGNIAERLPADWGAGYDNIWLGVSVENQKVADERIPQLLAVPAMLRFLSIEPLLGPIKIPNLKNLDWVLVGGESGNDKGAFGYRKCELEWIADIIAQCRDAGVPCFVKQLGTHQYKQLGLKHRHGGDIENWPEHLQIRQMPKSYGAYSTAEMNIQPVLKAIESGASS